MGWSLYVEGSEWWPLFSPPEDYETEAAFYREALEQAAEAEIVTLLELGSGGGHTASHLKAHYALTLVEPAAGMRAVSEELNPDCDHFEGDMRLVRLGRVFDAVLVHDAVCYMTTEAELRAAIDTAFMHCRAGGAALFAPDYVRETFHPGIDEGGADRGGRRLRFVETTSDPDPTDSQYLVEYRFELHDGESDPVVVTDRHVLGLFARADWLAWLTAAGFEPESVPYPPAVVSAAGREVFVARKPKTS